MNSLNRKTLRTIWTHFEKRMCGCTDVRFRLMEIPRRVDRYSSGCTYDMHIVHVWRYVPWTVMCPQSANHLGILLIRRGMAI